MLLVLVLALAINLGLFAVAFRRQTDKLTDISYALTFVVLVFVMLMMQPRAASNWLLAVLVTLWAFRLGFFLLLRIRRTGVDHRFDAMRNDFKKFGQFWLGQGLSVWIIMLPVALAMQHDDTGKHWQSLAGILVWGAGLLIESVADMQKYHFTRAPANAGKWIDEGLWRYSRHPNYFGEILVWVGVYLCALPSLAGWRWLVGAVGPLYISWLLLFVSGIPPLEKAAGARWGGNARYRRYKNATSLLVLLPRRHSQ